MSIMRYDSIYIGEVVDNNDPKQLGRLKVRIPSIYGNIVKEDLPWCEPSFPYGCHDRGFFFIPELKTLVTVMFINGSPYSPIWTGTIHREKTHKIPQPGKADYPEVKIIKTGVGYIMMDDKNENIEIKHKTGSSIIMKKNADIEIHAGKDIVLISDGNILMNPIGKTKVIKIPEVKEDK